MSQMTWTIRLAVAMFLGTTLIGALTVIYLPPTYFSRSRAPLGEVHPALYWTIVIAKNLLGVVLIALGIAMLVLPGQGVLTILIGVMLLSIPGKRRLAASVIGRLGTLDSVNRWRAKFGRSPLELPNKR